MARLQTIRTFVWRWLDDVASAIIAIVDRFRAARTVRLVELEGGQWAVHDAGDDKSSVNQGDNLRFTDGRITGPTHAKLRNSHVELSLRPERFVFKPLELPTRATEFLDGVVRAQIDRLTPWSAEDAAFGYTRPAHAGDGRIAVTVAATAKSVVTPFVDALTAAGAQSLEVSTSQDAVEPAVTVLQKRLSGIEPRRLRYVMLTILVAIMLSAGAVAGFAAVTLGRLQARQADIVRHIVERRTALLAASNAAGSPTTVAERALAKRKNQSVASVIVLEVLSRILPDDTYVTEMRIEGDKLLLTGITRDVPALIRIIEQSRHFNHATFFAPTTRAPSDPGDRFHIEAHILPVFALRS